MLKKAVGMVRAQKLPEGHLDCTILHSPSKPSSTMSLGFCCLTEHLSRLILCEHPAAALRSKTTSRSEARVWMKTELPQPLLSPSCQLRGIPVRRGKPASERVCSPPTVQACSTHPQVPHTVFSGHSPSLGWHWSKEGSLTKSLESIPQQKNSSAHGRLILEDQPSLCCFTQASTIFLGESLWIFISVSIKPYWAKWLYNISQYNYAWHTEERFRDT